MASDSDKRGCILEGCTERSLTSPGGCRVKVHQYRQRVICRQITIGPGGLLLLEVVCPKGEIMHATNGRPRLALRHH